MFTNWMYQQADTYRARDSSKLDKAGLGGEDMTCSGRPACFRKRYRQPTHISSVTGISRFMRRCAYDSKHA